MRHFCPTRDFFFIAFFTVDEALVFLRDGVLEDAPLTNAVCFFTLSFVNVDFATLRAEALLATLRELHTDFALLEPTIDGVRRNGGNATASAAGALVHEKAVHACLSQMATDTLYIYMYIYYVLL